jgi:hypothetical protein
MTAKVEVCISIRQADIERENTVAPPGVALNKKSQVFTRFVSVSEVLGTILWWKPSEAI